ncbi:YoaK family protein [Nocardia sp. alder85J]|uniref:YoaK family protein n=1 Tax=Nocardia sp. alder85J TaxID=2862949 RepID=UPI001CD7A358|nr:YoaK family protein [Nocardia sp. alder85J]MCX4091809.1 YoaK family protein [Nocardia sp. alder85J]
MTPTPDPPEPFWNLETELSSVLLVLAGFVGAAAYTHSDGYFVTFMTGNTERAVIGGFLGDRNLALGAAGLIACFLAGVFVGSVFRRWRWSSNHPHGSTVLATAVLAAAALLDWSLYAHERDLGLVPILFVSFAMGNLNTSFVRNGEVSIPVTYVTGTLVKFAQGLERHLVGGGTHREWLGYAVQYLSFALGALLGGLVSLIIDGRDMLNAAVIASALVAAYTWRADLRWVRRHDRA